MIVARYVLAKDFVLVELSPFGIQNGKYVFLEIRQVDRIDDGLDSANC